MLSQKDVNRIRDLFPAEFEQMKSIGVKRFKNHKIQIANLVKEYLLEQKFDEDITDEDGSKDSNSDSDQTDPYSINSENIEREFQNVPHYEEHLKMQPKLELLKDEKAMEEQMQERFSEALKLHFSKDHKKFLARKRKFDQDYEKTLMNFAINMKFLDKQKAEVLKIAQSIERNNESANDKMFNINLNVSKTIENLDEMNKYID